MGISIHIRKKLSLFELVVDYESDEKQISILGPSGCGKSMLLKMLCAIETPDRGRIVVDDKVLYDSEKKVNLKPQKRKIGYLFQNYALFPNLTVEENIGIGISDETTSERKRIVKNWIQKFALEGLEKERVTKLSGGQQQRVALARMLVCEPEMILLDEPFSALDGFMREKMQQEMMHFLKDYEGRVLLVSHNRDEIYRWGKETLVMNSGKIVNFGETKALFLEPKYVSVARLTGCMNIAAIQKKSENTVFVPEWNLELTVLEKKRLEEYTHIGIRAHDIKLVANGKEKKDRENTFLMNCVEMVESPFEYLFVLQEQNGKGNNISYKISKDLQTEGELPNFPAEFYFPKEKLLLLKEDGLKNGDGR